MSLEEVKQKLIDLSRMRRNAVDSFFASISNSLHPEKRVITYDEVDNEKEKLEKQIEGFYIVWYSLNKCYGIIPAFD